jgi:hypothetical protein
MTSEGSANQRLTDAANPILFENWKASLEGNAAPAWSEYSLYSDAWITSGISIGPYELINTLAHAGGHDSDSVAPVLVLRAEFHIDQPQPDMQKTDVRRYHGGWLADEVAALASLAMGIRMKAGPLARTCEGSDPRGRPVAYYGHDAPVLLIGRQGRVSGWTLSR